MRRLLLSRGLEGRATSLAIYRIIGIAGIAAGFGLALPGWAKAQNSPARATPQQSPAPADTPAPPPGQVLIQSHGDPPPAPGEPGYAAPRPPATAQQPVLDQGMQADLTDEDRSSLLITAYDLDARLNPARAGLTMRGQLTVRNTGDKPLKQLALQISSTLHWDSATLLTGAARVRLPLAQHQLDTDADHTGAENEAILLLPEPLAPGASASLDVFYSGEIPQSAGRLARLGANGAQQQSTDWDAISPDWTGVRGFGNVLWYPVASPQLFLNDGNALFQAVGRSRLHEQTASVHLRLSVEYMGGAPAAAYFCGRRQALTAVPDDPDAPSVSGSGLARAEFPAEPLGFRTPSLFVLDLPEILAGDPGPGEMGLAGSSSSSSPSGTSSPGAADAGPPSATKPSTSPVFSLSDSTGTPFLALVSADSGAATGFGAAADHVVPLLREWLGTRPPSALTAIDHRGQPFQDGPLLVAPLAVLGASTENTALIGSLTHAWVQTGQPWIDEGLAQFFSLLWTERANGRPAANAALDELMRPVALAEPDIAGTLGQATGPSEPATGQPLVEAADDLFYRRKAAAVWWMLRGIVGDGNLHGALSAFCTQPVSQAPAAEQAVGFERLLEKVSGEDLHWFFNDWVLRDRGLPDLTITDVTASQQPVTAGHPSGWIVAVTVRNEGGAVAEVPVVVHSGVNHIEQRLRIPGLSSVTQRILVETAPTSVDVNDGGTPELRSSTHTREIHLQVR